MSQQLALMMHARTGVLSGRDACGCVLRLLTRLAPSSRAWYRQSTMDDMRHKPNASPPPDPARGHEKGTPMKTIQVFDPALCCSTGVCGVDVDQALVTFSADVEWANQHGARIERFNLAREPMAFAENATVKGFLAR